MTAMRSLPNPETHPEFYENVSAKRLFAWVVDSALIAVAAALLVPLTGFVGLFIWPVFYLTVGLAYRILALAQWSATPGMQLAGIELRDRDGAPLDLGLASFHSIGFSVTIALPFLQLLSIVLMLTSTFGQGLSDHVLGTVMLRKRL